MTLRCCTALAAAGVLVVIFVAGAAGAGSRHAVFAPSGLISAGATPCSFAVAKLDGDDDLDLAVASCSSDGITVLLGDGSGHFRAADSRIRAGGSADIVHSADFNRDGKADLAVANQKANEVRILLGNGTGGFAAAPGSSLKIRRSPQRLASADLNGDGRVDLVVAAFPNRVAILLGDGSGRFAPAPGSPLAAGGLLGPDNMAVADFNRDRRPDLAVSKDHPMKIAILLGAGAGRFRSFTTIRAALKAVADFNGDGKPDLAAATHASAEAHKLTVLLGTGSGRFSPAPGFPMEGESSTTEAVAADFNGDRKVDLALQRYGPTTAVLLGDGRGRLRPAPDSPFPLPALSSSTGDIDAADLNRDGHPDIVMSIRRSPQRGGERGLAVLWRSPSGPTIRPGGGFPGTRDAVFSTRTRITHLAADGGRAAVATGRMNPCGPIRIVVWTATRRKSTGFDTRCLGDGVREIALGGGEVAWVHAGGGNDLELRVTARGLWGGKLKEIASETNGFRGRGNPSGQWLGQLLGGGSLLAYNSWQITCDVPPDYGCDWPQARVIVSKERLVRIVGRRPTVVNRGRASFALTAVGGGRMAVESAGAVIVLAPNGSRVATVRAASANPPRAVALSRTRLAVLRTLTLDLYEPATGRETKSIPLGPAAMMQLAGVNSTLALLRGPRRLAVVRLSDGKLISLALRTKSHVDAKLTTAGLFYAYNVRRGRAKGRIVFEPTARLLARF